MGKWLWTLSSAIKLDISSTFLFSGSRTTRQLGLLGKYQLQLLHKPTDLSWPAQDGFLSKRIQNIHKQILNNNALTRNICYGVCFPQFRKLSKLKTFFKSYPVRCLQLYTAAYALRFSVYKNYTLEGVTLRHSIFNRNKGQICWTMGVAHQIWDG